MEISATILGQWVRSARKAKEMTTEELAEKVCVAVESIEHIEGGFGYMIPPYHKVDILSLTIQFDCSDSGC